VARTRLTVRGREGGVPIEQIIFHVVDVKEGRLAVIRGFLDEREALEAGR
jgi:hypothetical protein